VLLKIPELPNMDNYEFSKKIIKHLNYLKYKFGVVTEMSIILFQITTPCNLVDVCELDI